MTGEKNSLSNTIQKAKEEGYKSIGDMPKEVFNAFFQGNSKLKMYEFFKLFPNSLCTFSCYNLVENKVDKYYITPKEFKDIFGEI